MYCLTVLAVADGADDDVAVEEEEAVLLAVWVLDAAEELVDVEVASSDIVVTLTVGKPCVLVVLVDVEVDEELDDVEEEEDEKEELDDELDEALDEVEEEEDEELVVTVTDVDNVEEPEVVADVVRLVTELEVVEDVVVRLVVRVELVDAPPTVADLEVDDVETPSQVPKRDWQPAPQ